MDGGEPQTLTGWAAALIALALILLSGLFTGAETAVFALGRGRRLRRLTNGRRLALRALLDQSDRILVSTQLLAVILNLGGALFLVYALATLWPEGDFVTYWIALALAALLVLVLGEALPRSIAARWTEQVASRAAVFLRLALFLTRPFLAIEEWLKRKVPGGEPEGGAETPEDDSEDEIKALLSDTEVSGLLDEDEREMIDGVFEFAETTAGEIMTPRTEIEGYSLATPQEEMLQALRQTSYSRVVIYEGTLDTIIGFLYARDALLEPGRPWTEFIQKPLYVPLETDLDDLLAQFKRTGSRLAIVLDEYGGTAGLVTLHDLLEEIMGEIPEEEEELESDVEPVEAGVWLVAGRMEVADCNEILGTHFPEEKARTMAGLVFLRFGRTPALGDSIEIEGAWIRILEIEENRIERLEIRTEPEDPAGAGAGAQTSRESAASAESTLRESREEA